MNPRRFPIWPAFDQGEVTDLANGRVDNEAYGKSCNKIQNFLNFIQGPVDRRPGSYHVGNVHNASYASRLIPFRYSADVSFLIEVGHQIMRFFTLGSRVVFSELVTNGSMEGSGGSDWLDVGSPTTNEYSTEQAHAGNYSRKVIAASAGDGVKGAVFSVATTSGTGMVASLFVYSSVDTILVQVRQADDSGWAYSQQFTVIPNTWNWIHFDYDNTVSGAAAYIQVVSTSSDPACTFYLDDVSVRQVVRTTTPWSASELSQLRFRQVGNVIYFRHPDYPDYKLTRATSTSWILSEVENAWPPFLDQNTTSTTIQASALTGTGITLTASSAIFQDGHEGSHWKISGDRTIQHYFSSVSDGVSLTLGIGESFVVSLDGTWAGTMYLQRSYDDGSTWVDYAVYTANMSLELINLEEDTQWRWRMTVYTSGTCVSRITARDRSGYAKITSIASPPSTTATADVIEEIPHAAATTKWSEGAWSDYQGYPRTIAFFENRRVVGSTEKQPTRLWGSKVDDYESFETGIDDDDSWNYALASGQINQINWLLDGDVLHIGTSGDEWKFGDEDNPTTPTAVKAKVQTAYGSADIDAVKAGSYVVFVEDGGRSLRSIRYNFERDKYEAESISLKAEHIFKGANGLVISEISYTSRPIPIIWCRMSDGTLRSATFDPVIGMIAFNRQVIGGQGVIESICAIRGPIYDELWLEVSRTINGSTARHIEYVQFADWYAKDDAYYVDAGYTFTDATPSKYITGLFHLEGKLVNLFVDGSVHSPKTVTNGSITLEYEASKKTVGLGFTSILTPKSLEMKTQGGDTVQSRDVIIPEIMLLVKNAISLRVGTAEGQTDQVSFRTTLTPLGQSPDLFSGKVKATVRGQGVGGNICIECDEPVPLTVIAIFPKALLTSDN